ncbi:unnamed protein product [Porites evermanni]|uniref:Uncharacterized protein n=1 Tax=Porites evermanni TaxID=104178 RepID=A0ABN8LPU6_9CNID|nr:unnamed protein product [Porites evermanni]
MKCRTLNCVHSNVDDSVQVIKTICKIFQFIGDYQENRDNDGKVMGSWQPEQSKGSMADTADFEILCCIWKGAERPVVSNWSDLAKLALAELPDPVGQQNCPLLSRVPSYSPAQGYGQVNESVMVY